jgi:hypothetical protein
MWNCGVKNWEGLIPCHPHSFTITTFAYVPGCWHDWVCRWIAICSVNRKLLPHSCNKQVIELDISSDILIFALRPSRWSVVARLYYQHVLLMSFFSMHCNWETCVWEVHSLNLSLCDYPNRLILDFLISTKHHLDNVKVRVTFYLCLIY